MSCRPSGRGAHVLTDITEELSFGTGSTNANLKVGGDVRRPAHEFKNSIATLCYVTSANLDLDERGHRPPLHF